MARYDFISRLYLILGWKNDKGWNWHPETNHGGTIHLNK